MAPLSLEAASTTTKEKVKNHYQKNEADSTAAVVSDTWPHVGTAAAEHQHENDEDQYEWHGLESSTRRLWQVKLPCRPHCRVSLVSLVEIPVELADAPQESIDITQRPDARA